MSKQINLMIIDDIGARGERPNMLKSARLWSGRIAKRIRGAGGHVGVIKTRYHKTAIVHVGPVADNDAIYCEAVELQPGQKPGQKVHDYITASQAGMRQQEFLRQSGKNDSLANSMLCGLGGAAGFFGGLF